MKEVCHLLTQLDKLLLDFVINLILPSAPSKLEFFSMHKEGVGGYLWRCVNPPTPILQRDPRALHLFSYTNSIRGPHHRALALPHGQSPYTLASIFN